MTDGVARRPPAVSEPLRRFLDGYLHQDFRLEHADAVSAARAFAAVSARRERYYVRRALRRFTAWAATVDETTWRHSWRRRGGAWHPHSLDAIEEVARALE